MKDPGHDYGYYCRPGLVRLLESIGLDVIYESAEGDYLWQRQGEKLIKVLDLVGGFGANLFGHHHPEIVAEAQRLLAAKVPIMAQGSCRSGAARLAKALAERLGDYIVIFTNSGAETIEAALKHAYLERGQPNYWAIKHAFHGKTNGAIQLTWKYREPYAKMGPQVCFLDPSDPATWEEAEQGADEISAAFIEPIQGEGGIRPLPAAFVSWVTRICRERGIPLVVDEIQTGMGRTGHFLASTPMGIEPDYLCLAKSLGGGLAKIGALLIKRERFIDDFSIQHTSTFAEDDLCCLIGLKALELVDREDLPARCAARGERLIADLEALRARFPDVIKEVRGRGLMVGVELQDLRESPSYTLRLLSDQGFLSYLAAAYLLNVHHIRVAPTLSQSSTIRIEPSAFIAEADLVRFVTAFASFCEAVHALDIFHLIGFLVGHPAEAIVDYSGPRPFKMDAPQTPNRVAFLAHLVLPEHISLWDPSLKALPVEEIDAFMTKSLGPLAPAIFDQVNIRSQTGARVHLNWIDLYLTSEQIARAWQNGKVAKVRSQIEESIALAREAGCRVVGLGGYTSILSGNGLRIKAKGIALTTGNSLTVGMGMLALKKAAREMGIELSTACLAVVGATGNIARVYAVMMAPHVAEMVLIVRQSNNSPKLGVLIEEIRNAAPHLTLRVSNDLASLCDCSLIVTASSDHSSVIYPEHLSAEPVVICDIALPADVDASVRRERPKVMVIKGGVVRLPEGNDDFRIGGLALDQGHVYACVAETLLMGLEGKTTHGSYGAITPEQVGQALKMAEKHGFTLGQLQTESFTA